LRGFQQRAGLHVELFHHDVVRQRIALHGVDVCQSREIIAEMARGEGAEEATLQPGRRGRRIQRQRRVDFHAARRISFDPFVQRIQQPMRLADAKWRADAQGAGNPLEKQVHGSIQVGQVHGHG